MKRNLLIICLTIYNLSIAQDINTTVKINVEPIDENLYSFTTLVDIDATNVKSQGNTGTCWSFSASSFLESEIYRNTGKFIDISEMYTVRNAYLDKAWVYVMRQGKAQFSDGGLGHHTLKSIQNNGLVPESEYSGLFGEDKKHNHDNLTKNIQVVLDAYIKNDKDSDIPNWKEATNTILDKKLGKKIEEFVYEGKVYTPESFLKMTQINASNYVTITSFSHTPYYQSFILNIPDNYDFGSFYNVPLEEFNTIAQDVLKKGYSIEWDGDVSEATFSAKKGIAVFPKNLENNKISLTQISDEGQVTQELRQQEFENYNTTDDHLMHIIGIVKDQKGNTYYKVKNSWGTESNRIGNGGYIYMSETYFKMKSISIMVHKDALSKEIKEKLKL